MKRLYLLRHGQTEYNLRKVVQGRCDSPLTGLGEEQARAAGAWLAARGVRPDRVVSSPLGRAMGTARIVAGILGFEGPVEAEEGIVERAYGEFELRPFSELPYDVWDPTDEIERYGGEGNGRVRARMAAALEADIRADGVGCLLAVSHGSASRQFIACTLGLDGNFREKLPNCAVMSFDFDEAAGRFEFLGVHDPAAE